MMTHRSSVVLFDAVVEAVYLTINVINALNRDKDTQSMDLIATLIEMASLCLSSWGCVSSLSVLSQYYFHYTYTGIVVTNAATNTMVVQSVDATELEDAPPMMEEDATPQWTSVSIFTSDNDRNDNSTSDIKPPEKRKRKSKVDDSIYRRAILPVTRTTRIVVTTLCAVLAIAFYVSTITRIGIQDQRCRDLVGSALWSQVSPKLLFPDGFGSDTRCDLSVAKSIDLSGSDLDVVPEGLRHFTSLKALDLSRNHLKVIPKFISELPLTRLDVSVNMFLSTIHPAVLDVPPLDSLRVSGTAFEISIDWSHAGLNTIPRHLLLLNKTDTLLLGNNNISNIDFFSKFDVTHHLDLSYNNITSLPPQILAQIDTSLLNLSHNALTSKDTLSAEPMAQGIGALVARVVDMRYNQLDEIPTIFVYTATLPNKPTIYLSHNNIRSFDGSRLGALFVSLNMPFLDGIKDDIVSFDASQQYNVGVAPMRLANSTSLRYLNFSDLAWGGSPDNEACPARRYDAWWALLNTFPSLETLDISFDPSFGRFCLVPLKGIKLNIPTLRTLWVRGATDTGILHCDRCFDDNMNNSIEEIDASGYNASSATTSVLPTVTHRFRNSLKRLYLDSLTGYGIMSTPTAL
eukprot:PhM_4_TR1268/c1_g2_i1/m.31630